LRAYAGIITGLSDVMTQVNLSSCRDTLDSEFVTLALGMIDPQSLVLTYCSAGHDPALLFTPGKVVDGQTQPMTIAELATGGMALGIDEQQTYEHRTIQLEAGQVLVMHTDGLTDATDFHGKRFGHQRVRQTVLDLLAKEPLAPAGRIVEHLMWTVRQFAGVRLSNDDITLVVVRVEQPGESKATVSSPAGRA
jgi:sigma-B regulation protein RsbU (phosphoserine phosphatase)